MNMNLKSLALSMVVGIAVAVPVQAGNDHFALERWKVLSSLQSMQQRLDQIERIRNPHARSNQIHQLRAEIDHLARTVQRAPSVYEPTVRGTRMHGGIHRPMTPVEFSAFLHAYRMAPYDREKVAMVRDMSRSEFFLTRQVVQLVQAAHFSRTKVDVAAILYNRTVDPRSYYQVYSVIPQASARRELRKRIGVLS